MATPQQTVEDLKNLSAALGFRGDPRCVDVATELLQLVSGDHGRGSPEAAVATLNLAYAYLSMQDWARAARFFSEALATPFFAAESVEVANALSQLGYCLAARSDAERAVSASEKAVAMARRVGDVMTLAKVLSGHATTCSMLLQVRPNASRADLIAALREAESLLRPHSLGADDASLGALVDLAATVAALAREETEAREWASAEAHLRDALTLLERQREVGLTPRRGDVEMVFHLFGQVLGAQERPAEQEQILARLNALLVPRAG